MKDSFIAIGVMSGTSLDGLDITLCRYWETATAWDFELLKSQFVPYNQEWQARLRAAHLNTAIEHFVLERDFTQMVINSIQHFMEGVSYQPDCIGFHGHTIFHQPDQGFTVQMGNGAALAAQSNITTVCDFRRTDVALGGEGAPLVPIGDQLLFGGAPWLNLGGIANISYSLHETIHAYDICFCNMLLNAICLKQNIPYDPNGENSRKGRVNIELFKAMELFFIQNKGMMPSLGKELFEELYQKTVAIYPTTFEDALATSVAHIVRRIIETLPAHTETIMVTGGGAHNTFLIEQLNGVGHSNFSLPNSSVVDFKEAIIFGFLAVLRMLELPNALSSVTHASHNSCGGAIYSPKKL